MELASGQTLELRDAKQRTLGRMTLEERDGCLLRGSFAPGPDYQAVEQVFRGFEEAANAQALRAVDERGAAIAALGLSLCVPGGGGGMEVGDVQIWSDGGMSCRLAPSPLDPRNGQAQAAAARPSCCPSSST